VERLVSKIVFLVFVVSFSALLLGGNVYQSISVNKNGYIVNGEYKLLRGGTIQWFRMPSGEWEDKIKKFKAAGFNTIDMYVAWNNHEKEDGVFTFAEPDIRGFLDLAKKHGLFVYFRPGPYFTNEYNGGGVPSWLLDKSTKKSKELDGLVNMRTEDPDYLFYVERYLHELNLVIKPYLISNGGPIILYSVENEYNWFEIFHEVDKVFWYDGGFERDPFMELDTYTYMSSLRDIVQNDEIDVPITTCPGAAKVSGMGGVEDIIPMPNLYIQNGTEKLVYDTITDMHNPANHGGSYADFPSGLTESDRLASRMKRTFMGGMDSFFAFNIVGMHQEGYNNAIVMNNAGPKAVFDFDLDSLQNLFLSPMVGYFGGVVDYYGAISPSGLLREKFYQFRRTNMFLDSVEHLIAPLEKPMRSGIDSNKVAIISNIIGSKEGNKQVHYWFDAGFGRYFISLLNETGTPQILTPESIIFDGEKIPKYTNITVPVEIYPGFYEEGTGTGISSETELYYDMILATNLEVSESATIHYSTSEILTNRSFNNGKIVVLYGAEGSEGETNLVFDGNAEILWLDQSIKIEESNSSELTISYTHEPNKIAVIKTARGEKITILITTLKESGRIWFFNNGSDYLVTSLLYADEKEDNLGITAEFDQLIEEFMTISGSNTVFEELQIKGSYNPVTGATFYTTPQNDIAPTLPAITSGKVISDIDETKRGFNASSWKSYTGFPKNLEKSAIYDGHAWYRAEFNLASIPKFSAGLYIEHGSDIIGIYLNDRYITTVSPMGTEIDSKSLNSSYSFEDLKPYLKKGKNVIVFRTEIWGHGSFMWPRGRLAVSKAQLPSIGYDSVKGLFGRAEIAGVELKNWKVGAMLGGEKKNYATSSSVRGETASRIPLNLLAGNIVWYRTTFKTEALYNQKFHAPVSLQIKGKNTKATIYLNGKVIARWLSDTEWLSRGTWIRPMRDMWSNLSPDQFPISLAALKTDGSSNMLAIVFEDCSDKNNRGIVEDLRFIYSEEEKGTNGINTILLPKISQKRTLEF